MHYKILIIDDLKSIFTNIENLLTSKGCEVTYSANGYEGLAEAQKNNYDLIILDIHMPDINGLDVCKQLKNIPYYHFRPILLLTSDTESLDKGLLAGASDYILKPFSKVEMIARVFTQLHLSQERLNTLNEKIALESKLEENMAELQEAHNDLRNYFYQAAHKLRSPIKSMKGLLSLLKEEDPVLYQHMYIKKLGETVNRLDIINAQIALIGELKAHLPIATQFNLKNFLEKLISKDFPNDNVKIAPTTDFYVNTDAFLLYHGLHPIIQNAVYYSEVSRKSSKEVYITAKEKRGDCYLLIKDNGIGINPESFNKIFNMFYIGNEVSRGNGLGLFISKMALNKSRLEIRIKSKQKEFTTAKIKLTTVMYNEN
ncbi:hybrid sensor histidine kinase/response regulator [Marivirga lumbricoides]|uniref:Hybrid sensor histidine kinase/response regulator n=1 Tax=Marivirga lumbricoides TaxID=1046115 RepID=A0ABQ1N359_9BACT|nr:hybrid sensor histidine kinase/response regulator [Marivirga lumbricoides]